MTRIIALLSLTFILSACSNANTEYDLKPIFSKGDKIRFLMVTEQKMEMTINGKDTTVTTTTTIDAVQETKSVDDKGSAVVEITYERIRHNGANINFDSDTDKLEDQSEPVRIIAMLKDIPILITYDKDGQITDVSGHEELFKSLGKNFGDAFGEKYKGMTIENIIGDSFKNMATGVPPNKVRLNDSWKDNIEVKNPLVGNMKFDATYTFAAIEDKIGHNCAKITMSADISIDGNAASPFKTDMKPSKTTGTVWIDLESRVLVQSESTTSMEMTMTIGETKTTTKTTSTTKMTLKED